MPPIVTDLATNVATDVAPDAGTDVAGDLPSLSGVPLLGGVALLLLL